MEKLVIDKDVAKDLFRELMAEMRWRREVEYKILTNFIAVSGFSLASIGLLCSNAQLAPARHSLGVLMTTFFIVFLASAILKICNEHATYQFLGQQVVKLYDHWEIIGKDDKDTAKFFAPETRRYGHGGGYVRTILFLIATCCIVVAILWSLILSIK
jgi:hypothetical protein